MKIRFFKKSVLISLIGHLTVFSIFSLSFGPRITQPQYSNIYFWGQLLQRNQLSGILPLSGSILTSAPAHNNIFLNRKPDTKELDKINKIELLTARICFKPQVALAYNTDKEVFILKPENPKPSLLRKESAIIFHPVLPYNFALYFKDRQIAHVELMYKSMNRGRGSPVMVKRAISSGNLEVDLLSLRYISRYLFTQRKSIAAADWRSVKIDLSAKND